MICLGTLIITIDKTIDVIEKSMSKSASFTSTLNITKLGMADIGDSFIRFIPETDQ